MSDWPSISRDHMLDDSAAEIERLSERVSSLKQRNETLEWFRIAVTDWDPQLADAADAYAAKHAVKT